MTERRGYRDFVKLMEQDLGSMRVMEALTVTIAWLGSRALDLGTMINMYISNMAPNSKLWSM